MHIYIDESGDTGYTKKSTKYFILTAVVIDNPFVLNRIVKSIHKFKINKKKTNIIHSNAESYIVKNKLIKKLLALNHVSCKCFVFDKMKTKEIDLYIYGLTLISEYFSNTVVNNIIIARKDTRSSYNDKILSMFSKNNQKVHFSYPTIEKPLQIADFYSWSIFSYLEHNDSQYFTKLKNQIELIYKTKPSRHV